MKFKSLLVLGGMLASSLAANAQWEAPVKANFEEGKVFYLYNADAKAYFCGANDWNTRASVSSTGYKVKFEKADGGETYWLRDSVNTQSTWKATFADAWNGIWVDNVNGANVKAWTMTKLDNGNYKFFNAGVNPEWSLGVAEIFEGATGNTRLWLNNPEATYTPAATDENPEPTPLPSISGKFMDEWYFVDLSVYEICAVYAPELKKLIDQAEAEGIDATAAKAVYNNTASTIDDFKAAIAALSKAIKDAAVTNASVANPSDLTSVITNPNFDGESYTGWNGSGFGKGGETAACAERYNMTFDTYQDIIGLPKGVYALSCDGFYRAGSTDNSYSLFKSNDPQIRAAKLYAISGTDTISAPLKNNFEGILPDNSLGVNEASVKVGDLTYYVPNSMKGAVAYFEAGYYKDNMVVFACTSDTVRIGLRKDIKINDNDWTIVDSFKLLCYGNGADAYQKMLDVFLTNFPTSFKGLDVTPSVGSAFLAALAANNTAATYEEFVAKQAAIAEAYAIVEANMTAWANFLKVYEYAKEVGSNKNIAGADKNNLTKYLFQIEEDVEDRVYTTEQLIEMTAKLQKMADDAVANGLTPGSEYKRLVNPSYSDGAAGWEGNPAIGGFADNKCAEAWNKSAFDVYQVVENAPVGLYEISVQGFYREWRGDNAWNLYFDEAGNEKETKPASTAFVYLNNHQTPLKNVFDERVAKETLYDPASTQAGGVAYSPAVGDYWYANGMDDAARAFAADLYQSSAYGAVAKAGDALRIGVKGSTNLHGDSWAIWDNFKLIFWGYDAEHVDPLLTEALDKLNGYEDNLFGTDVKANVAAAIEIANGATDGEAMFNALVALYDLDEPIEASKKLFVDLQTKHSALESFLYDDELCQASDAAKNEATLLLSDISDKMWDMTDAEAKAALEAINAMSKKLRIPASAENATDAEPADLTAVIETATFDIDGVNSAAGWTGAEGSFGPDDTQKGALAYEFYEKAFDVYQDIVGLPAGTYHVGVNAFYRNGSTANDFATANEEAGRAQLYAVTGGKESYVTIASLASGALDEPMGYEGETTYTVTDAEGIAIDTLYIPNNIVATVGYFLDAEKYQNGLYMNVADGTLRIGARLAEKVSTGWFIMDNWTLTYYGANSSHAADADGIESVNLNNGAKMEFYSINGVQATRLQKGINVVRFLNADGTTTVKKILVK